MDLKNTPEFEETLAYYREIINYNKKNNQPFEEVEKIVDMLSTVTEDKLKEIITNNIITFYTLPLGKILYHDSYYRNLLIEYIKDNHKIPPRIMDIVGPSNIYQDQELVDLLFSNQIEIFEFYVRNAPEDIQKRYLDGTDPKNTNPSEWRSIIKLGSDELKDYFISNKKLCEHIYTSVISSYKNDMGLNSKQQSILWNNVKELVKEKNINEQVNILKYFDDKELKKYIIEELNLLEYIHLMLSPKVILDMIDDERKLFDLALKGNVLIVREVLPRLTPDNQRKVLDGKPELLTMKVGDILSYVDTEVRLEYFKKNLHNYSFYKAFSLYKKSQDKEILDVIVNGLLSFKEIKSSLDILDKNEFVSLLTEEQQRAIADKLSWPISLKMLENSMAFDLEDSIITRKFISNLVKCLNKPEEFNLYSSKIFRYISKYLTDNQMLLFCKRMNREKLMEYVFEPLFYNKIMLLLKENPNYFNSVKAVKRYSSDEVSLDEKLAFLSHLTDEQVIIFFSESGYFEEKELRDKYRELIKNNTKFITTTQQFNLLNKEEQLELIRNLSLPHLINVVYHTDEETKKILFDNRRNDIIKYIPKISSWYDLSQFLEYISYFDNSERIEIYNSINKALLINTLSIIPKENEDYVINLIIENDAIEMINSFTGLDKLKSSTLTKLCNSLSDYSIINFYSKTKLTALEEKIKTLIKDNFIILGHPKCILNFDIIMNHLSVEEQEYVQRKVEELFSNIDIDDSLKTLVNDEPLRCKMSLIYAYNNGYLNGNKLDIFKALLDNDKYLLYNLDFRLLSDEILTMGSHFIAKTSRYPKIVSELSWLFEFKPKKGELCKKIVEKLLENESTIVYDQKIDIILSYLCDNNDPKIENIDINNTDINSLIDYIIERYQINNDILNDIDCDVEAYYETRNSKCDQIIKNSNNIEEIKNAFFTRYFWLSSKQIEDFLISYGYGYDEIVKSNADSTLPLEFIDNINKIRTIYDINTIKEIYNSGFIEYSISDYFNIVGIMKEAYNKTFTLENSDKQESMIVTNGVINDGNNNYEVIEILDNFGLFIHSTDAYGNMTMINDNYFDSWNNNTNTANHGICACYITNTSFGIPPVKSKGVLFGFTNINSSSINLMAPYDLVTKNDGYNITSARRPMYLRLNNTSDYTRHTHNEFSLERRNGNNDYPCTEPDCVIIFSDMSDEIKQNSLKAVEDFKEHGIELKIYYIDRVNLLNNEASKNNKLINQYLQTKNISLLQNIVNNYESLRCCSDFINGIDIESILNKQLIYDIVISTSIELLESNNVEDIKYFIDTIENEEMKFNLIKENVGGRAHTFDLLTPELENNLHKLREKLNKGGLSNELTGKINS